MSSNRDIWVNRCRQQIPSRFSLAQAAVLRWEQLLRGARPRITTENPKWMETPLREIAGGAVSLDVEEFAVKLGGTPYEPPRPEPSDELDDLLGGALENLEGGTMPADKVEVAVEVAAEVDDEPKPDTHSVDAAAAAEADTGGGSDADADTGGDSDADAGETGEQNPGAVIPAE